MAEQGKYVFEVNLDANKPMVKEAVEKAFKVVVVDVHVMVVKGKKKRYGWHITTGPTRKKAIVTLKKGDKIEFFEGA